MALWGRMLAFISMFFALVAVLSWLALHIRPVYAGRLVAVPNHQCDVFLHTEASGMSACGTFCCEQRGQAEFGVCMVKLELFAAKALGIPVVLSTTWAPCVQEKRPVNRACSTKNDTLVFEMETGLAEVPTGESAGYRSKRARMSRVKGYEQAEKSKDREGDAVVELSAEGCGSDKYEEVNQQAQSVYENARDQALLVDGTGAIAVALCTSCGMRLLTANEQAVSSWSLIVGILLGNIVTVGMVLFNTKRQKGRTSVGGWRAAVLILCIAALVLFTLWGLVHGGDEEGLPLGSPIGWLAFGSALSLLQGVGVVGALVACLQWSRDRMWLLLGLCSMVVILTAVFASPSWKLGHIYATLMSMSMLSFGLLLGPVGAVGMLVARWGISLESGHRLSN